MSASGVDDVGKFVMNEFGAVRLGDERLNRRLLKMAESLTINPAGSIPQAAGSQAAAKALYRFCANDKVERNQVIEPHFIATTSRMGDEDILVVEDTTYLNFTHHPATQGIGTIGSKGQPNALRGVLVHSSLAIRARDHEALGLVDQEVIIRTEFLPARAHKKNVKRKRPKESEKWARCGHRVIALIGRPERLIFVFDREGDVFEAVEALQTANSRFVIRASCSRRIESEGECRYSFETVMTEPVITTKEVVVPRAKGRKERRTLLSIRAGSYRIMPPSDRRPKRRPCEARVVNIISVREEKPPAGVEGIEWILMTSEPFATAEELLRIVAHYEARWKIEEWHKALKTGCRLESRQLEEWHGLNVLLGVFSVIAWRMLALRDAARSDSKVADEVLSETHRDILRRMHPEIGENKDAMTMLRVVARLGGFLGRKHDGHPGWITLWRGFIRLFDIEVGYALAQAH